MNTLNWTKRALKQLRKLDRKQAKVVFRRTQVLENFPECKNVKKLSNHPYSYRLRIGDYRVFFEFNGEVNVVTIEEVKKRDEHTY